VILSLPLLCFRGLLGFPGLVFGRGLKRTSLFLNGIVQTYKSGTHPVMRVGSKGRCRIRRWSWSGERNGSQATGEENWTSIP